MTFPLYRLPTLAIENVFANTHPYDLFVLSTLSKRSEHIVKICSKRRHFAMRLEIKAEFSLSIYDNGEDSELNFRFIEGVKIKKTAAVLKTKGDSIQACCVAVVKTIQLFGTDLEKDVIEHLTNLFQIAVLDIFCGLRNKKRQIRIHRIVKSLQLKVQLYTDLCNNYDYEEIEGLMDIKTVELERAVVSEIELRKLFSNWINRPICEFLSVRCAESLLSGGEIIGKFLKEVKKGSRVVNNEFYSSLEFDWDDGRTGVVKVRRGLLEFEIKASESSV